MGGLQFIQHAHYNPVFNGAHALPTDASIPTAQSLTSLRKLLDEAGLSPRKRHGQHFLIDANLMQVLVDSAELSRSDCVIEVGVGTGSLTNLLAARCGRVLGVEIDARILCVAEEALAHRPNVTLINADALRSKSTLGEELLAGVRDAMLAGHKTLRLVANLPYDIATPLVINLLLSDLPLARLCFTVQKEVGDRFTAAPDTSDYGAVGIIAQTLSRVTRIARVPAEAFWPRPKVESVMIRLDPLSADARPMGQPSEFAQFVRGFFQHRRKTMSHLMKRRPELANGEGSLEAAGVDPRARPEQLSVPQWHQLYKSTR
jgi:16S rRNA (adenine1518-N6/adenine1519-N6)-dimethyltransferase